MNLSEDSLKVKADKEHRSQTWMIFDSMFIIIIINVFLYWCRGSGEKSFCAEIVFAVLKGVTS